MKRYRVSRDFFARISNADNTWKFLVDWFDYAMSIRHLDRVQFSESGKRLFVYDAGINGVDNSFFIEAKKSK